MSPSHDPGYDDHTLTEYLLGRLPEQEAERIDEESLIEESLSWQLRVVEEDLIDAYVRGTLDGETKALFEASYLTSERRRAKVQFATDFLATIDRAGATVPAPRAEEATAAGLLASDASRAARRSPIWLLAAAAAIVIGVGGFGWYQQTRLRQELTLAQQDRNALDRRVRALERELTDQRAGRAQASTDLARVRTPGPGAAAATTDSAAPPPATVAHPTGRPRRPAPRGGGVDRLLPAAGTPATFALRRVQRPALSRALRDPGESRRLACAPCHRRRARPSRCRSRSPRVSEVPALRHRAMILWRTGLAGIVATYAFEVAQRWRMVRRFSYPSRHPAAILIGALAIRGGACCVYPCAWKDDIIALAKSMI